MAEQISDKDKFLYCFMMDYHSIKKMKIKYAIVCLLIFISTVVVGYVDTYTVKYFFITVPFVALVLPEAFLLIACFNFITMVDFMNYKTYEKAIIWTNKISKFILVCAGICVAGEILVLILDKKIDNYLSEMIFLAGVVITLVLDIVLISMHKKNCAKIIKMPRKIRDDEK